MDITLEALGNGVIYAGAIAVALAAIGAIFRYTVLSPLKRWIHEVITQRVTKPLDSVKHEVVANGDGRGSVKDQIGRIESQIHILTERFDRHLETHRWDNGPS